MDFYGLGTTQGYHSLALRLLKPSSDNVLHEHGELPQVFPLTVHLIFSSSVHLSVCASVCHFYGFLTQSSLNLRAVLEKS